MDGFELNKITAAILLALLIGMLSSMIANHLVVPEILDKNVYIVEGLEEPGEAVVEAAPKVEIEPIEAALAAADVDRGKTIAKKCIQCHTFEKGGPNRVGPNLWSIVSAKVAQVAGFTYSRSMSKLGGIWTFERLNSYLYKPRALVKGTKMAFAGLKKVQDRADVVAYMNSMSDSPQALPAGQTKDEDNKGEEQ